jgi:tetratricopeptide (TPR) repeat protein
MERVRCDTCGTYHDMWAQCPRCYEIEQHQRIAEQTHEHEEERSQRELEQLQQNDDAEQRRHEEHLEAIREEREASEASEERIREAIAEQSERHREIMEAETEHRRDIAANAWKLEAEAKRKRGDQLMIAGLYEEALAKYREAVSIDPANLYTWHSMTRTFSAIGDDKGRRQTLGKEIALLKLPEYQEMLYAWEGIFLQLSPTDSDLLNQLRKRINEAAQTVRDRNDDRLDTWFTIAKLCLSVGDSRRI